MNKTELEKFWWEIDEAIWRQFTHQHELFDELDAEIEEEFMDYDPEAAYLMYYAHGELTPREFRTLIRNKGYFIKTTMYYNDLVWVIRRTPFRKKK